MLKRPLILCCRLVVPGALKGPVHLNRACSGHERIRLGHERIRLVAGELAKDQAKDAGMGWGQGTQDGAAAFGNSQDVPGCNRDGKRIR